MEYLIRSLCVFTIIKSFFHKSSDFDSHVVGQLSIGPYYSNTQI